METTILREPRSATYFRLELGELETPAVKLEDLLGLGWLSLLIRLGRLLDVCR